MQGILLDIARFTGRFTVSIVLWVYAGLLMGIWHMARMTPGWAVLLRVAASILNDLIWAPLSVIAWTAMLIAVVSALRKRKAFLPVVPMTIAVAVIHIVFLDSIFRLLFIPLTINGASLLWRAMYRRETLPPLGWLAPLVCAAALTMLQYGSQMVPRFHDAPARTGISIMSYNIYCNGGSEDRQMVLGTIKKENPDVVCCIEFNFPGDLEFLDHELVKIYPYSLPSDETRRARSATMIYSRYPITAKPTPMVERWGTKWAVIAELDVKGKKLNLVNYHLKTVGHYIEYIADEKYTLKEKMRWAAGYEEKNDHDKYSQAKVLVKTASAFTGPTVLCGDLNDTPNSRVFHIIDREFRNTFSLKGWGLGATFGEMRIRDKLDHVPLVEYFACDMLRIDHIFVNSHVRILSSHVITDAHGSDHKPVTAVISF